MKRLKIASAAVLILALTSSCTSYRAFQRAQDMEVREDWDAAVEEYSKALEVDPDNTRYRVFLQRAKLEASRMHFQKGKSLRAAGQNELAAIEFQLTVKLDPTNQFAAVELGKAAEAVNEARRAADRNSIDQVKKRAKISKAQPPQLNPASQEPISLSFPRETPVKDIYRALGNAFGINILFDAGVKDDRIAIELRDVTAQQALERLMQAANHFYKVLDEKTLIVIPDNPQARRDYEDLVIRTFYLSNGDAEQVTNVVRTMIEARNVFPLKALNAITIRDTADKVRIAEKIIEANDKARAEVVVDVELLQLDLNKARQIGIQIGGLNGGGALFDDAGKLVTGAIPIDGSGLGIDDLGFTVPSISYNFIKSGSDTTLLAKPQLRISEGEKATLTIGQRVPVPVSTFSSVNPGGSTTYQPVTSYQYQDVGIKINMEPRVHHNREVTLKLTVEVSNLAGAVGGEAGQPSQPIIGTRTIESTIRLKDGETNFLAGLIRKDDSIENKRVPFLGEIPILGRLLSHENKTNMRTDLVLTMTPHIIRIPDITEDDLAPMWVGTTNNLTFRGVSPRLESPTNGDPFNPAQREEQQFEPEPRAGDFPRQQEAAPNPVYLPPGAPPGDPFRQPPPAPLPDAPETDEDQQQQQAPPKSLSSNGQAGDRETTRIPRIAPQPATLAVKPGELKRWTIVGMDLDGAAAESLQLRYDPSTLSIEQVVFGAALKIDPTAPPLVNIDKNKGTITIRNADGKPLQFDTGGEIVALQLRGVLTGESYLLLDGFNLIDSEKQPMAATVTGGRSKVQ